MTPVEPNPIAPSTVGINPIPAAPAADEPTAAAATPPVWRGMVSLSLLFCLFCLFILLLDGSLGGIYINREPLLRCEVWWWWCLEWMIKKRA